MVIIPLPVKCNLHKDKDFSFIIFITVSLTQCLVHNSGSKYLLKRIEIYIKNMALNKVY